MDELTDGVIDFISDGTPPGSTLSLGPRAVICVDDQRPPYSFVQVQGTVTIGEDPADLDLLAPRFTQ